MPNQGYDDYQRLSRGGNVLLWNASGNLNNGTFLFSGYVGNFAYTSMYVNVANFADFEMIYYQDGTYSQAVGQRDIIRGASTVSICQYGNISEWMRLFLSTLGGPTYNVLWASMYGTNGEVPQNQLASASVPLLVENVTVPATTTQFYYASQIRPGPAWLFSSNNGNGYIIQVQYFDFNTGTWITTHYFSNTNFPSGINSQVPMLDAPMRLAVDNTQAVAQGFTFSWFGM
jgi:hypothetical protein